MQPIYLDYMASTPVDPLVLEAMLPYLSDPHWCANPASTHHWMGQEAMKVVELSRHQIAECVGAFADELLFTSGATEANNLAIMGAASFYQRQGRHLITLQTEHKAVLNVFEHLETQGFSVTYLKPLANGLLNLSDLEQAIRPDTILASVMQVNNEIGVIQDIEAISKCLKSKGVLLHVDAAQSFGRVPIDLSALPVDLMSFSAHKVYGPKGIGALFVRKRPRVGLNPILFGGGQEKGLRPGTLATHQIVGMAKAFELASISEQARLLKWREQLRQAIDSLGGVHWHGDWQRRVAGNLNVSFEGVDGNELITNLYPLIVSSQSACSAASGSSSHVLKALGVPDALARACLRISLGRFTKSSEIEQACVILKEKIGFLRK
jgi:cysteine desulfurase